MLNRHVFGAAVALELEWVILFPCHALQQDIELQFAPSRDSESAIIVPTVRPEPRMAAIRRMSGTS